MSNVTTTKPKLPTLTELVEDTEMSIKDNQLTVLLNQQPPENWVSYHPTVKIDKMVDGVKTKVSLPYLPIERVEWLLVRIYGKWESKINSVIHIANSVIVTVTITVTNPITKEIEKHDGIGAAPLQTDAGKSACDWNYIKANSVQIGAPAAESYAIKDACEKFGKLFGSDLGRKDSIGYDSLLKESNPYDWDMLRGLWSDKMDLMDTPTIESIDLVIVQKDKTNYSKSLKYLQSL